MVPEGLLSFRADAEISPVISSSAKPLQRMSDQPAKNGMVPPPISEPSKAAASTETKPKKRICCACPDTKKLRDECIVEHGESACTKWIEAHKMCLRAEGFNV